MPVRKSKFLEYKAIFDNSCSSIETQLLSSFGDKELSAEIGIDSENSDKYEYLIIK
jgi:hypothetical protein